MLESASENLLVRKLRAGDIDSLRPLYETIDEPLAEFCESITHDAGSATLAAESAFAVAAERLAAQHFSAGEFRAVLCMEARCRSYDALEATPATDRSHASEPFDLDALRARIERIRPESAARCGMQMPARRKLRPASALVIAAMLVMMIDLVAAGLPFGGGGAHRGHESTANARHVEVAAAASLPGGVAAKKDVVVRRSSNSARSRSRGAHVPKSHSPAAGNNSPATSTDTASGGGNAADKPSSTSVSLDAPAVPVAVQAPTVDVPPVQVQAGPVSVDAGPVKVDAAPVQVNAGSQGASACVVGVCVGVK